MKRANHLYELLVSDDNLKLAILEVNSTHRWYPQHHPNRTVRWVENDIPARIEELRNIINGLIDGTTTLEPPKKKHRFDKSAGKLSLVERITEHGVMIGVYCSQWFANTILQPLDHMIREGGYGVTHYLRYMDNFTIFSSNKRKLRKLFKDIQKWLAGIGLQVKGNWQIFPTASRLPTALGYRYGHGYTLLRKRNLLRLKRRLGRYYKKKREHKMISRRLATGLLSRLGQLQHCNRKNIYKKIYRGKVQRDLKNVVREHSRRMNELLKAEAASG